MKITKVLWLFGVLCVCAVWGGTVFADTCNPGEYMVCNLDPQYGTECNDCGCATCPPGQTSDGTGFVSYCPNQSGSTGCYTPTDHCPGYTPCPEDVGGSGKKCKEVSGCPNGCHKYEICDTTTGAITYQITGPCHLEGSSCYSNTVPCSTFVIDHFFIGWNCDQGAQIGMAKWETNTWDTKNCTCAVRDRNITAAEYGQVAADAKCQNANADFYVEESYRYSTTSVDSSVIYSVERLYCKQCYPGYLPFIVPSPNDGVDMRPASEPGDWGTSQCTIQVSAPYYADGCIVDWGASTGALAVNECKNSCPAGMILNVNGATDPDQCEVDPSQRFTDNTGTFIIGEGQCSTPGGGGG